MFFVTLFFILAFFCPSFLQLLQSSFFVHALPKPRTIPDVSSVASRGTSRQITAFLDAHNVIRKQHGASSLSWSHDLADRAAFWADTCKLEHSGGMLSSNSYGENIAGGTGGFSLTDAVATFIDDKGMNISYSTNVDRYLILACSLLQPISAIIP